MPSRSTIMTVLWALGAIAVVSRVPAARAAILGA